jgi:hypothetical protein
MTRAEKNEEIARLLAQVVALRAALAAPQEPREDTKLQHDCVEAITMAADSSYDTGFKAGIEAAAKVAEEWARKTGWLTVVGAEIRSLSHVSPPAPKETP